MRHSFLLAIIFLFSAVSSATFAGDVEIAVCTPRDGATFSLIYLHGLDPKTPSKQELQNRSMLETLSKKYKANFIVPRSNVFCKQDKRCWLHEDTADLERLYNDILSTTATCIKKPQPIVLLGFSNGGYFSSKAGMLCYPGIEAIIASGSAGQIKDAAQAKKPAGTCPPIYLTIGEQDITLKKAQIYFRELEGLGRSVTLRTFKGRHELSKKTLDSILEQVSTNIKKKKS